MLAKICLALRTGNNIDIRKNALEVAELLQKLGSSLISYSRYTGDIVGGIALKAIKVRDHLRSDSVTIDHGLAIVGLRLGNSSRRRHHFDMIANQLEGIAISSHNSDPHTVFFSMLSDGSDHIIGFITLD